MHAGPVRGLRGDVILLQPERDAVALKGLQKIAHITRIRLAVIAGGHVPQRVHREHIVRGVPALVPGDHAGHIRIGKMRVHLRQIARIVETEGNFCRHKEEFMPVLYALHHILPGKLKSGRLLKIAFLGKNIPHAEGDVAPVMIVADEIYSFQWSLSSQYSRRYRSVRRFFKMGI